VRLTSAHAPLLAVGACSLIWQVASARSILAGLHGNELTLGLVLGSWLLLTGLSTALSLRATSRWLAPTLLLLPLGLLASLVLQQQTLPAFTAVGQVVGPGRALLSALLCLLPACAPLGVAFGLVTLLRPDGISTARWAARLFVLESLGTVAAGLLFHFWLAYAPLSAAALSCGAACWLAAVLVIGRPMRRLMSVGAGAVGAGALLYLGLGVAGVNLPGLRPTTPGYDLLEQRSSPHAALAVARRGDQVVFLANGVLLFTNQDHRQAETDVHLALLAHRAPRRVLMIGGGMGGGLAEVLKHPVERVDYVELDPVLVELARRWGGAEKMLADRRVRLLLGDGRAELRRGARYDVILVGVPGPSSALLNRYYTVEFFREAARALGPGGVLRVVLAGKESLALDERMARVHASVQAAMQRAFRRVKVLPGGRTFMLASQRPLELTFVTLVKRLRARRLEPQFFSETELMDRTLELKHEHYLERLRKTRPLANTDLHPAVYFREALAWIAPTAPALSRGLGRFADRVQAYPWAPAIAVLLLGLGWGLLRRRAGGARKVAAGMAMAAAGLSGLAVELSLLLAAQTARGVVYHEIGALLTAFMAGLALGAPAGRWLVGRAPRRALQLTVGAVALTSFEAAGVGLFALRHPGAALPLLLAQMLVLGAAVGATYPAASDALARGARAGLGGDANGVPRAAQPVAAGAQQQRGARAGLGGDANGVPRAAQPVAAGAQQQRAPGRAYAWDLSGAALGALVAAGIALPVLGLPGTCLTCGALCLGVALTARG
jgi:spermidine synthase